MKKTYIQPQIKCVKVGFHSMVATSPGLESGSVNQNDIDAKESFDEGFGW